MVGQLDSPLGGVDDAHERGDAMELLGELVLAEPDAVEARRVDKLHLLGGIDASLLVAAQPSLLSSS